MSAIFGKCNSNNRPVTAEEMATMRDTLNHWVADRSDIWMNAGTGMGHLMLMNTPESRKEQLPFADEAAGLCITADARIDNREDLFALLGLDAHEGANTPDSRLILLLYKKYGGTCVRHLVGDFAFAIWDQRKQLLFCARDHMGVKPFFYYYRNHTFIFASEKKGILCLPDTDKTINRDFFYNQAFSPHIQAIDTTIYQHIVRLPPAHTLSFSPASQRVQTERYWNLDAEKENTLASFDDYTDGIRFHFENAVKCRLRSLYPVGAELSGGIDSSSIVGVASSFLRQQGKNIVTFSNADSPESLPFSQHRGGSDIQYAEDVVAFNGIAESVLISKGITDDPIELVQLLLAINDGLERWNLAWALPIKQEAQRRNIRTLLSGFAGDEMVTYRGDNRSLDDLDQRKWLSYLKAEHKPGPGKFKPFIHPSLAFILHRVRNLLRTQTPDIKKAAYFFKIPLQYRLKKGDVAWQDIHFRERFRSYRHFQKYRLLKPQVSQRMETETHYATWFRQEVRYPMADIRLTQFYLSIPNTIKYTGAVTRYAWRKAVGTYLPESVLQRDTKVGIMTPYMQAPSRASREKEALYTLLGRSARGPFDLNSPVLASVVGGQAAIKYIELIYWLEKNFGSL